MALYQSGYSGQPMETHRALSGVEPRHFTRWLGLFRDTLEETAPDPDVKDYLMDRAERIASSLERAMIGVADTGRA